MLEGAESAARFLGKVRGGISSGSADAPIVVDGILGTSSSTLRAAAIALAALKSGRHSSVYYLCFGKTPSEEIFKAIGAKPLWLQPETPRVQRVVDSILKKMPRFVVKRVLAATRHRSTLIEHYITDSLIRNNQDVYSIDHASRSQIVEFRRQALDIANAAHEVLGQVCGGCLVMSHRYYNHFGIPGVVALGQSTPVIANTRAYIRRYSSVEEFRESEYTLSKPVLTELRDVVSEEAALEFMKKRFSGERRYMDVWNTYSDNPRFTRGELLRKCGLAEDKPLGVIMPHAFSDAPHCDSWSLFDDYFTWFKETLALLEKIPQINWIIKPHPASYMYFEDGLVGSLCSRRDHLAFAPSELRTDCALRAADAVVTVRGTAGLEGLYFGATSILCGAAWYDSIGSVVSCRTIDAYRSALEGVTKKREPASDALKADVGRAMLYRFSSRDYTTPAFGQERPPGLSEEEAHAHDTGVLKRFGNSFREPSEYWDDPFVSALVRYFSEGRERLSVLDYDHSRTSAALARPDDPISQDIPE